MPPRQTKLFTLEQSNALLPLIRVVAREVIERRLQLRRLRHRLQELRECGSPEGMRLAIAEVEARIFDAETGLERSCDEFDQLGLTVLRANPLTLHFPGRARHEDLVFCWQEGEDRITHGHIRGEERDPRRPLKLRVR